MVLSSGSHLGMAFLTFPQRHVFAVFCFQSARAVPKPPREFPDPCRLYPLPRRLPSRWAVTLLLPGVDMALHESTAVIFKEGHAIEVMSAVLLASAAVLWWGLGADDMAGRQWHIPVISVLMAMREMDFDKRFTSERGMQLRLYSGGSPLWEKTLGLMVAKTLDGLDRKLAGFGVTISPELGTLTARLEEFLELAAYMMLVQAPAYFLRCQRIIAARAALRPCAAYRPRGC